MFILLFTGDLIMMSISTKGRYALRVMIDLSEHNTGDYIPLSDIARRQDISEKYLESIVSMLSKNGLVSSLRGKGGGYKLNRAPDEYTVLDILTVTEGSLAPVACLEKPVNKCNRAANCKTLRMWKAFYKNITDFFGSITVADLVKDDNSGDYII